MSKTYHPLIELTRVRVNEFLREPEAVFWVFVFPVLLALALGIAFSYKPAGPAPVAVVAGQSIEARKVAEKLMEDENLKILLLDSAAAEESLRKGRVDLVMDLSGLGTTGSGRVAYRLDPSQEAGRTAHMAADNALQRILGRRDVVPSVVETVRQPGSRYIDFLIPGLVGLNLMGSGMWSLGFAVVMARTRKLLKRFAATPMRRSHYLVSFALSRLIFLGFEVAAVVGFGWIVFDVRVHGSLLALAVVTLAGSASFAGLGLLTAARPRSVEAVSGWMNFVMLPMWLLSGTFFSYERFPDIFLPYIRALPLTALNDALRAVMNDGAPLWAAWSQLAVLCAWGAVSFVAAMRIFRWQ